MSKPIFLNYLLTLYMLEMSSALKKKKTYHEEFILIRGTRENMSVSIQNIIFTLSQIFCPGPSSGY